MPFQVGAFGYDVPSKRHVDLREAKLRKNPFAELKNKQHFHFGNTEISELGCFCLVWPTGNDRKK